MKSGDYYQLTVSGKGYGLYKLAFSMKGSNTGAKNWTVSYSTDGENYSNIGISLQFLQTGLSIHSQYLL